MEGEGGGEGGEKRMEMEMDVTPQQDTCICECRCNYSVHVLSTCRITDHHYYEVFSHAYLHVQCTCTRALLHTTHVCLHKTLQKVGTEECTIVAHNRYRNPESFGV